MSEKDTDRFERQSEFVPRPVITESPCTVIGCGAIGRQVAIQLAAIGVPRLTLIDFDNVDLSNVTTQGFSKKDVGKSKVLAVADHITGSVDDVEVVPIDDRYRPKYLGDPAVFSCVDKIQVRELMWKAVQQKATFWVDGRMSGEVMRIIAIDVRSGEDRDYYPRTLFAADEAQGGRCTAKSTIYTASIAGGLMVHQFTRFLRNCRLDRDVLHSLPMGDVTHIVEEELVQEEADAEVEVS